MNDGPLGRNNWVGDSWLVSISLPLLLAVAALLALLGDSFDNLGQVVFEGEVGWWFLGVKGWVRISILVKYTHIWRVRLLFTLFPAIARQLIFSLSHHALLPILPPLRRWDPLLRLGRSLHIDHFI